MKGLILLQQISEDEYSLIVMASCISQYSEIPVLMKAIDLVRNSVDIPRGVTVKNLSNYFLPIWSTFYKPCVGTLTSCGCVW